MGRPRRAACTPLGRYFGVDFGATTDYAAVARGFGWQGVRVEHPDQVEPALRQALATDGPTFVDILSACETDELPPVTQWQRMWQEE